MMTLIYNAFDVMHLSCTSAFAQTRFPCFDFFCPGWPFTVGMTIELQTGNSEE
jgi:hypothetical protein